MSTKIKLIISNLLLIVTILLLVGTTIAYFTDNKTINNTMTSGNVNIALTEAAVTPGPGGHLVEDTTKPRIIGSADSATHNYGTVYAGQQIFKDPTLHNIGTNDAWMAAKVTLSDGKGDLHQLIGYPGYPDLDIELLLHGGLLEESITVGTWNGIEYVCYNDHYAMVQVPGQDQWEFYFFLNEALAHEETVLLFDSIQFSPEWDNGEMEQFRDFTIKIQAFGVQAVGFEDCFTAMTQAFPDHFNF